VDNLLRFLKIYVNISTGMNKTLAKSTFNFFGFYGFRKSGSVGFGGVLPQK